jgi:putative molybdopterin biosynthesis protein
VPSLTLTVPEVAALLRIGRDSAYDLVSSGRLPVLRIGRKLRVPRASVERLIDEVVSGEA